MSQQDHSLLKFPCEFPIKAMGYANDDFQDQVLNIVKKHAPDVDASTFSARPSKDGKYLAVTITIQAQSQSQLDNIYLDLNACDEVVMCL